jgi:glyoxylase I family protein
VIYGYTRSPRMSIANVGLAPFVRATTLQKKGTSMSARKQTTGTSGGTGSAVQDTHSFIMGLWGVRYQVKDVSRSVEFYTQQLGFKLDRKNLPAFAQVSVDGLKLILSGPGASGSRPIPDGRQQEPGGWNRIVLEVSNLPARIEALKGAGLHFATRWKPGRVASKSNSRIPTAIRSSSSSLRVSSGRRGPDWSSYASG